MALLAVAFVQDEADGPAAGVGLGQGENLGAVGLGRGRRVAAALQGPFLHLGQHEVGAVDLVAGGAEVPVGLADVFAAGAAVFKQLGGLRLVRVVRRAAADARLGLERRADRSGVDKADQARAKTEAWWRAAIQMASRQAVTWSTGLAPGVGCDGAVADEPLVQGQLWWQPTGRRVLPSALCRYLSCACVWLVSPRPPVWLSVG
jgi:hypothetical protein